MECVRRPSPVRLVIANYRRSPIPVLATPVLHPRLSLHRGRYPGDCIIPDSEFASSVNWRVESTRISEHVSGLIPVLVDQNQDVYAVT